jgi:hypothetical protein
MATNLTAEKVKDSFSQLLHIDGGPEATPKTVYSGTGTATALKVGTTNIEVDNIRIDGNTISTRDTNGDLVLSPNGTGAVVISNVEITGGTITGASFPGSFTGITLIESTTLATSAAAAGVNLNGNTLGADGTDTDIDINITPKGTGEVNVTNIDVLSGKVPFTTITGRAFAAFSDITDQTGSTTAATPVKFGTTEVAGAGITMVTDGTNLTRLTFAAAGTYAVTPNLQMTNTDGNDHDLTIWFALNGTNIPRSTTRITVPKATDGGNAFFQIVFYVTVTAGQYIQVLWLPENVAVTLDHTAAVTGPPAIPAIPSAIISAERIA